ncbi:MAG: glycosyltransferase [Pseudomonadales bacterium]|nr:glycosyltransferase [Pseudomonadales bacterium]
MTRNQDTVRFTVITSTFNCDTALAKTAQSIREQSYSNIQWIIADGASTDDTLEVIKNNTDIISDWFSEPDKGIYDAWNKASRLINGDWVIFLGASDRLFTNNSFSEICQELTKIPSDCLLFYGNVLVEKPDGRARYVSRKPRLNYWEFGRPALPHHQGVFQHHSLFEFDEPFDSSYAIAGDSKFLLQSKIRTHFNHIDLTISKMADDGVSNNYRHIMATQKEINRLCNELDLAVPVTQRISALLNRAVYFIGYRFLPQSISKRIQKYFDKLRRIVSPPPN